MLARTFSRAASVFTLTFAALATAAAPLRAADGATLRAHVLRAFAGLTSYKVTVLGSVRSVGVWVAPDRYHMTTEIEGKPLETVIVGKTYWTRSGGSWERAGTTSTNLDVDIAGLVRAIKASPKSALRELPPTVADGKKVGTFAFAFADGTSETCNYDLRSYRVTRCKSDEVTLLYGDYNDPKNVVPKV